MFQSPFERLRLLLGNQSPETAAVHDLSLGEPRGQLPPWLMSRIERAAAEFLHYPKMRGSEALRSSIAGAIKRRGLTSQSIDPEKHILPVMGSREGIHHAIIMAVRQCPTRHIVQFPDPGYPVYAAAARACGATACAVPVRDQNANLIDLAELSSKSETLAATAALVLCNPANPQGSIASRDYLVRAANLAREHGFILIVDECYSDVYDEVPPVSALDAADQFYHVLVFNSLSKRSCLPGLRSGYCAGDSRLIEKLAAVRNSLAPQMPGPLQHASIAAWDDDDHVDKMRTLHKERLNIADATLGDWSAYRRPAAGLFVWLNVRPWTDLEFVKYLWRVAGVKVLPGSFLCQSSANAESSSYVRIAIVQDAAQLAQSLSHLGLTLRTPPCA